MRAWAGVKFLNYKTREEWLALRKSLGIGGSEAAAVLGLSPYSCAAQVFYEKLGFSPQRKSNLAMIIGNEDENKIAKLWSFYDPERGVDSIPINYEANNVIRKPLKLNRIVVNTKYPQLFSSTDRLFYDEHGNRCLLELKTIRHWESKRWESGVPIHYLVQVQHYMLVLGVSYSELAILEANESMTILPFEPSKNVQETIITRCGEFYEDLQKARKILAEGGGELDIQHLVPGPDGSDAYTSFLAEKYKDPTQDRELVVEAGDEDYRILKEYLALEKELDKYKVQAELRQQMLKERMAEIPVLDFKEYGRITWRQDKNGRRAFKKSIKEESLLGM
jgi:putative phage-type endonuclease